jgi:excisionase family DNA binding protein
VDDLRRGGAGEPEHKAAPAADLLALLPPEMRVRMREIVSAAPPATEAMIAGLWLIFWGAEGQSRPAREQGAPSAPPDRGAGKHLASPGPAVYTAAEAAAILKVTASWLREMARRREIPYTMPGGSYHFTDAHLEEIVRLFERPTVSAPPPRAPVRRPPPAAPERPAPLLQARTPRRLRRPPE